jgi:hypothetical protein
VPVSESFPVRGGMLAVGCLTAAIVFAVVIPEKGEVVRLMTHDAKGQQRDTDLWIADVEGQAYFRAGSPQVEWLDRLGSKQKIYLERDGDVSEINAAVENDPRLRDLLDEAMEQKYGLQDHLWSLIRSSNPVAIRISPVLLDETLANNSAKNVARNVGQSIGEPSEHREQPVRLDLP